MDRNPSSVGRPSLQDLLVDTLKAHGLNAFTHQDWVVVDGNFPAMTAAFVNERQLARGASVQLDIRLLLDGGRRLAYNGLSVTVKGLYGAVKGLYGAVKGLHEAYKGLYGAVKGLYEAYKGLSVTVKGL